MTTIQGITDDAKQRTTIVLADGSRATLSLEYRPNQLGWYFDVEWSTFAISGQRLVTTPNILRQFRERVPFGIAVVSVANAEPLKQTDFLDGTVVLYLLDETDVSDLEATVFNGP